MAAPEWLDDDSSTQPGNLVIFGGSEELRAALRINLEAEGHIVRDLGANFISSAALTKKTHVAIGIVDRDDLPVGPKGKEQWSAEIALVIVAEDLSQKEADQIFKMGAFDLVHAPAEPCVLLSCVRNALRQTRLRSSLVKDAGIVEVLSQKIVGRADAMHVMFDKMRRVKDSTVPVFLNGESGSGKELVARAIHHEGARSASAFVELNCAAIAESLQESELFGHERGAFTGAVATHKGKFEQANRGTLFLDEVGELSSSAQARLLRVLQTGSFQRVGGTSSTQVDVRIISATHRNLEDMVREGRFRQDLYYRIVVYPVVVPALRDRREDIPLLLSHFLRKHIKEGGGELKAVDPDALDLLCSYSWPGNVRELENAVRRALLLSDGPSFGIEELPSSLVAFSANRASRSVRPFAGDEILPLAELEQLAIAHAVKVTKGDLSQAARRLGIGRATLYRKLGADPAKKS